MAFHSARQPSSSHPGRLDRPWHLAPSAPQPRDLAVTNRFDRAVGLGLGFHPWLPRHAGGRLRAATRHVWISGPDKIPFAAETPPADWDLSQERPLPERDLDHGFGGSTGAARYVWPAPDGIWQLAIASDCGDYIVYAPANRPFFCFEPTSHKPSPGQTGGLDGLIMVEGNRGKTPGSILKMPASGALPQHLASAKLEMLHPRAQGFAPLTVEAGKSLQRFSNFTVMRP